MSKSEFVCAPNTILSSKVGLMDVSPSLSPKQIKNTQSGEGVGEVDAQGEARERVGVQQQGAEASHISTNHCHWGDSRVECCSQAGSKESALLLEAVSSAEGLSAQDLPRAPQLDRLPASSEPGSP